MRSQNRDERRFGAWLRRLSLTVREERRECESENVSRRLLPCYQMTGESCDVFSSPVSHAYLTFCYRGLNPEEDSEIRDTIHPLLTPFHRVLLLLMVQPIDDWCVLPLIWLLFLNSFLFSRSLRPSGAARYEETGWRIDNGTRGRKTNKQTKKVKIPHTNKQRRGWCDVEEQQNTTRRRRRRDERLDGNKRSEKRQSAFEQTVKTLPVTGSCVSLSFFMLCTLCVWCECRNRFQQPEKGVVTKKKKWRSREETGWCEGHTIHHSTLVTKRIWNENPVSGFESQHRLFPAGADHQTLLVCCVGYECQWYWCPVSQTGELHCNE